MKDFKNLNLRIGKIMGIKDHPKKNDIYVIVVGLGPVEQDVQTIAPLRKYYKKEELLGKQVAFLLNIERNPVDGFDNDGLILTTHKDNKPILIVPEKDTYPGVRIEEIR